MIPSLQLFRLMFCAYSLSLQYTLRSISSFFSPFTLILFGKSESYKIYLYVIFSSLSVFPGSRQLSRYSDSLWAGRSGDRIPVVARFTAPVQTGPGAHPASLLYNGYRVSFPGVKRPRRGVDHPPHLAPWLKKE